MRGAVRRRWQPEEAWKRGRQPVSWGRWEMHPGQQRSRWARIPWGQAEDSQLTSPSGMRTLDVKEWTKYSRWNVAITQELKY